MGWILVALAFLTCLFGVFACRDEEAFNLYVSQEYARCISLKESEFTCKAYTSALEAKRSAEWAGVAANNAAMMSAARIGR